MHLFISNRSEGEAPPELESQFILRLPPEPAKILRELIQSGANNLKDRLSITIENDMRTGEVRLDHMLLHAKVVDYPTIIESLKTIDNKTFYKTADICQMLLCKEDDDQTTTDDEVNSKAKKKDPNRVEKKYLYPHGLTPPMKNVRKRRFRKTLKKKYVEAPEIEKEVKRLLRVDNEAVNVKWEVINEEDEKNKTAVKEETETTNEPQAKDVKQEPDEKPPKQSVDLAEQEIFGSTVSDSEEETNINIMEIEDTSRLSADDSRLSDTVSQGLAQNNANNQQFVTEFSKDMFKDSRNIKDEQNNYNYDVMDYIKTDNFEFKNEEDNKNDDSSSKEAIKERMEALGKELTDLKTRRQQQETEIGNIENMALRQRLQDIIDNLLTEQLQKEHEYEELKKLLKKN
ncbi:transcription initiation factor TFIID subunit, putative [Pediculus humanus corporis]|uniref:Transcription initiation factor TFIID subunit, putative n=1 Tax=Pediculus humanus subsp. corporis TaxID=121224 RepID=E0VPI1_PEDHC|nr:transcription initiation factor TFIID subunit, putative [Pediculus humanus corporis]EEB15287.1 transcription initiation factor TFIID subunit, putative [Pediculus humanus corporis]